MNWEHNIEAYLCNQLTPKEQAEFYTEIQQNPKLREMVIAAKKRILVEAIATAESVERLEVPTKTQDTHSSQRIWIWVLFLLLIGTAIAYLILRAIPKPPEPTAFQEQQNSSKNHQPELSVNDHNNKGKRQKELYTATGLKPVALTNHNKDLPKETQETYEWVVKMGELNGYSLHTNGNPSLPFVAIAKKDKVGFFNFLTKKFIPCKFDDVGRFSEGLASVEINGKWGFIDTTDRLVIPCQFDAVASFSEGLAEVKSNGKWGLIDQSGKIVTPCQFDDVHSFEGGLAEVELNGKWGFIDKSGKIVISCQFDDIYSLEEGLARVQSNGKWGLIDQFGKIVISCQFDDIYSFEEGLARVKLNGKWGVIDKSGKIVISCQFDDIYSFEEGLARIKSNGKWGFIDQSGKIIIPCQFDNIGSFNEGLARVQSNGKWGLIDQSGNIVIHYQFDHIYSFQKGLAEVQSNGKRGLIGKFGEFILPCTYQSVNPLYGSDLIRIEMNNKYGLIKKNGAIVLQAEYDDIDSHSLDGTTFDFTELIKVSQNGKFGFVNQEGKLVIPVIYDEAHNLVPVGFAAVKKAGKFGLIDRNNHTILPYLYECILGLDYMQKKLIGNLLKNNDLIVVSNQYQGTSNRLCNLLSTGNTNLGETGLIKICHPPTITWQNPARSTTTTPTTEINLKACIESNCKIKHINLYIDGELHSTSRNFVLKPECTGRYFEQLVTLPKTRRPIKITLSVTTNAGTFNSERVINIRQNPAPIAINEKRIALVIGNSAYPDSPLRNPVNDAQAMKTQLEKLGFTVMLHLDVSYQDLINAINDFGVKAREYDLALVYYAGHGIQYEGENFLVPIDAKINYPETIRNECVGLDRILDNLAGTQVKVNVVILDARSTNSFRRNWPQASRNMVSDGLTSVEPPLGTLIAYAAGANQTADDNPNEPNGLYTGELLKNLKKPGLPLEQIFRETRAKVIERTKNTKLQVPAEYSMLVGGDVILNRN